MRARDLSRRDLLATAAVLAASSLGVACHAEPENPGVPEWLASGFDRAALITLGGAYLATHPAERTIMALDSAAQTARGGRWSWSTPLDLPSVVAREFAVGDTVLVDGWLLARTEARLCARMALSAAPSDLPARS